MLKHHEISSSKSVIYCWIPSHIGIYGNEKVDKSSKESLNLEVTDFKIPFNNFKPFINKYVCDKWQTLWDETPFNKLKEIEPIVNHHRLVPKLSRREEIVLARLRIGHTRLTHSCLLKREERPYCIGCDTPFTVRHFLLDCADFERERRSHFQVNNLKDMFKDVSVENILTFLKNVNLVNKIYTVFVCHLHRVICIANYLPLLSLCLIHTQLCQAMYLTIQCQHTEFVCHLHRVICIANYLPLLSLCLIHTQLCQAMYLTIQCQHTEHFAYVRTILI